MLASRRRYVIANWKMNLPSCPTQEYIKTTHSVLNQQNYPLEIIIAPPATMIKPLWQLYQELKSTQKHRFVIAGQDCHEREHGAYTGSISASLLSKACGEAVIIGHSERRQWDSDAIIRDKILQAQAHNLRVLLCVGESRECYEKKQTQEFLRAQLEAIFALDNTLNANHSPLPHLNDVIICYEPLWAIGSGLTPTLADVAHVRDTIDSIIADILDVSAQKISLPPVVYGGSVTPKNAANWFDATDGVLVGGASINAQQWYDIISLAGVPLQV